MESGETLLHTNASPAGIYTLHQFSDFMEGLYNKKVEGIYNTNQKSSEY